MYAAHELLTHLLSFAMKAITLFLFFFSHFMRLSRG